MKFTPKSHDLLGRHTMRLQLVALIDVVLFILLYFMLSSSFAAEERTLASTLGVEGSAGKAGNLQPQIVLVEAVQGKAQFRVGDRVVTDRAALASMLTLLPKREGVIVKAGADVPVSGAATALQVCKDAGFSRVSYVAGK